jgi:hypothetical protein
MAKVDPRLDQFFRTNYWHKNSLRHTGKGPADSLKVSVPGASGVTESPVRNGAKRWQREYPHWTVQRVKPLILAVWQNSVNAPLTDYRP